jgi:carboxymethylenebutenolidase
MSDPSSVDIHIPLPDGKSLRAALVLPEGDGPCPGLVVLHEAFGLNRDMRRIAARLAATGYAALAPDLYSHGNRGLCLTKVMLETVSGRAPLADIDTARRHLAQVPGVDPDRIGVIGFCQGGGFALALAATGAVKAAAVNYGAVPRHQSQLTGVCPVVASYGAEDRLFATQAQRLERYLTALGVPHDVKTYDGVGHSFLSYDNVPAWIARLPDPMHTGYDEAAAEDAWSRIFAFFDQHLR